MILRLLLLALLIWAVLTLFKQWRRSQDRRIGRDNKARKQMLPCEVCGVHVPADEAIHHDGKVYCSQQHLEQDTTG